MVHGNYYGGVTNGFYDHTQVGGLGYDYGVGPVVAYSGFPTHSHYGYGRHRHGRRGGRRDDGLTGNNALNGILATLGAGFLSPELGGTRLGGGGGAAFGSILGDGDAKDSALWGAGIGLGINALSQFADGASFDGKNDDGTEGKKLNFGSMLSDAVTGGGLAGLFNIG